MTNNIGNIGAIGKMADGISGKKSVSSNQAGESFKTTLKSFLKDVNSMQNHADQSIEKMSAGEIKDVHQVMMAVEEANLSFNLMMEIRGKVLDAYKDLMRMQV